MISQYAEAGEKLSKIKEEKEEQQRNFKELLVSK